MSTTYHRRLGRKEMPSIRLQVPPEPRYVRTVRDAIIGFASLHAIGDHDLEALLFAVGEALANAMEHSLSTTDIVVEAQVDDSFVTARVTDHGSGGLAQPIGPVPLPDVFSERGRGIPIMQRCTDLFQIEPAPGGGTVVTLGRRRRLAEEHNAAS